MKKPVIVYCLIAFAVTWAIAFGIVIGVRHGDWSRLHVNTLHALAALGPTIGALVATRYFYGQAGVKRLLGRLRLRLPLRETRLLVFSPVVFFIFGLAVYYLLRGEPFSFYAFARDQWSDGAAFAGWLLPLLTYAFFEEIGWRGFLLPHLQEKYSAWMATLYLTVVWALWHVPFFLYRFEWSLFISVGFFFGLLVGALLLTAIYNDSRGYLGGAMLFHFLNNLCSAFEKEIVVAVLSVGFVFLAVYVYRQRGAEELSYSGRVRNYLVEMEERG